MEPMSGSQGRSFWQPENTVTRSAEISPEAEAYLANLIRTTGEPRPAPPPDRREAIAESAKRLRRPHLWGSPFRTKVIDLAKAGKAAKDIAAELGCAPNLVHMTMYRARRDGQLPARTAK